jgi:hypothetical protein
VSEFTSGFLMERIHMGKVAKYAQSRSVMKELNHKWIVYLTEGDNDAGIMDMSHEYPVMYFDHEEDHGWGYRIYDHGKIIASLRINYELEEGLLWEMAQERYPEGDLIEIVYNQAGDELREEIKNNFDELILQSFAEANIGSFAVFGFTHEQLETLNATLTPSEVRSGSNIFQIVNTFKSVLQLEEMSWINYDHVVEDANYDLMFD